MDGKSIAPRPRGESRIVVCLLLFFLIPWLASAETRIVVFTPTTEGNTYWPQVYEILDAAAEDLGVELLGFEFDVVDRFAKADEGVEILRSLPAVHGAIFSVAFGQTEPLLDAARELDIPVMIQGPLFDSELPALGFAPRRRYENWIGTFREDEHGKGYRLGRLLIARATELGLHGDDGHIHVAGVGGDPSWFGSRQRADGLLQAVEAAPQARLLQVVPTQWTQDEGAEITRLLLERYRDLGVLWAASDQLAIGATAAAQEAGLTVGSDVVLGGLDLSRRGLEEVAAGSLTATVASPLFIYAEVLIYLYDYIHGFDFATRLGTEIVFAVEEATTESAAEYLRLYDDVRGIDYSDYSRAHNPELERYEFPWNGAAGVDAR